MKNKIEFFAATILLFGVYFGLIPYKLYQLSTAWGLLSYNHPALLLFGILLVLIGISIYIITTNTFFKTAGNTPLITHPTKNVMKTSLYSKTRNPMYIGHLILLIGEVFITGSILVLGFLIITAIGLHLNLIYYEEPLTKKRLGKPYEKYLEKIPRWL